MRGDGLPGGGASKTPATRGRALCCPPRRRPRPSPAPPVPPPPQRFLGNAGNVSQCRGKPASSRRGRAGDPAERSPGSASRARVSGLRRVPPPRPSAPPGPAPGPGSPSRAVPPYPPRSSSTSSSRFCSFGLGLRLRRRLQLLPAARGQGDVRL